MAYSFGHRLPPWLAAPLFGDRARFGLLPQPDDPCWQQWQRLMPEIYKETQSDSALANLVNSAGYRVMREVDLSGLKVLEIGPGPLPHARYWRGTPAHFTAADIRAPLLDLAAQQLTRLNVPHKLELLIRGGPLPWADDSFDLVLSFYSLEHLYPPQDYLGEIRRVLRPDGGLLGAIPAEGGLAWGLGRYLTTRRWFLKNTTINPDKLICWEHPNFADALIKLLGQQFSPQIVSPWPFPVAWLDINLVVRFLYRK